MPQTAYVLDNTVALAGQIADSASHAEITSKAASEVLSPGLWVVLDAAGTVSLPKTAGGIVANGTGSLVGIVVYDDARGPGQYQIGEMVPILRQGRIWTNFSGTAPTENKALAIMGASDNSGSQLASRGFVTDAAVSTTVGLEKTAFTRGACRGGLGTTLAIVEVNLP